MTMNLRWPSDIFTWKPQDLRRPGSWNRSQGEGGIHLCIHTEDPAGNPPRLVWNGTSGLVPKVIHGCSDWLGVTAAPADVRGFSFTLSLSPFPVVLNQREESRTLLLAKALHQKGTLLPKQTQSPSQQDSLFLFRQPLCARHKTP